jgi:two-component system, sensor histidine kinase
MLKTRARKPAKKSAKRSRRAKTPARRRPPSAARLRAIEIMLAELAHDIRTPLTGILALGELLATSELGERERGWAAAIKSTAEHLSMLTSLIVDAARAGAKDGRKGGGGLVLRRELMHPRRFAETLAASLTARAQTKDLDAEVAIAENLPEAVIGDPLRLRAALENLIDNAVKFTERGRVRFEVNGQPAVRGRVRLVFTVADSGIGLTAGEIGRLFRPFAQANEQIARRFGGAGLGLAFVKRIARAMGGDLAVTSARGRGSRFRLEVTLDQVAQAPSRDDGAPSRTAAPSRPLNVLCAEDNPYGRVVLNTILTELGHRADFVGSGEAAVEAAAAGGYDVVLMDVTLPGLDGLAATRRIRALGGPARAIPIIGISGRVNAADEAASRSAGMNGYLAKPISPSTLSQALQSLPIGAGRST